MSNTVCVYHSADLDGLCSGAIMLKQFPDAELIGYDYGEEFPWEKVVGKDVVIADVCIQPFTEMVRLRNVAKSLTWLDHHVSAINDCVKIGWLPEAEKNNTSYCRDENNLIIKMNPKKAACEICWEHFEPTQSMPKPVRLLGRYDIWDHKDKRTLPFQYGARMHCTDVQSVASMISSFIQGRKNKYYKVLREGKVALAYQQELNSKVSKYVFETEIAGYKAIALNVPLANSKYFDDVYDENKHDVMVPFFWSSGEWKVSMYTTKDDIDCSVVAKSFGGGGHKMAAGFQCGVLPFVLE